MFSTISNIAADTGEVNTEDDEGNSEAETTDVQNSIEDGFEISDKSSSSTNNIDSGETTVLTETPKAKKRKNTSFANERLLLLKQIAERQNTPQTSNKEEHDETDDFFASMAKIVKKMPSIERAHLRMEVGQLIGKAELRYLNQQKNAEQSIHVFNIDL